MYHSSECTHPVSHPPTKPPQNGTTTTTEDQPTPDQKYQEALRDAKVSFLKSLVFSIDNTPAEEKEAAALYGELREGLLKQYPTHLPLLLEWLKVCVCLGVFGCVGVFGCGGYCVCEGRLCMVIHRRGVVHSVGCICAYGLCMC